MLPFQGVYTFSILTRGVAPDYIILPLRGVGNYKRTKILDSYFMVNYCFKL